MEGGKAGVEWRLVRSFGRLEPRALGLGIVVSFLIVTATYLSAAKFDPAVLAPIPKSEVSVEVPSSSSVEFIRSSQDSAEAFAEVPSNSSAEFTRSSQEQSEPSTKNDSSSGSAVMNSTKSSQDQSADSGDDGDVGTNLAASNSHVNNSSSLVLSDDSGERAVVKPTRKPQFYCDRSDKRIDLCRLEGDVRILGKNASVLLVDEDDTFHDQEWLIKPYPRKADPAAMLHVEEVMVRAVHGANAVPQCTETLEVPALVFSDRGYTGNFFHDFTDVILPLFLTAREFNGEVQFLVTSFMIWWVGKYLPVFKTLSHYDVVDFDNDDTVRCYPRVFVGLTSHDDFRIDPARSPNGYSMLNFTTFMRSTYALPRHLVSGIGMAPNSKPRLLILTRGRTRRFANVEQLTRLAERVGFEVAASEALSDVARFAELVNTCDVVVGVHGAGLTNIVFLPTNAVVIQIVPWGGLEWVATTYFGVPARAMGLKYIEYSITPEESTLSEQFPRNHTIFTDPAAVRAGGWDSLKVAFLDKQDVRLNLKRFRPVLKKAIKYLQAL